MHIYPFQPLVPSSDQAAAHITCPHYDTYSTSHLQAHLRSKPHSFMSVMRPDALLTSSTNSNTANNTHSHSEHDKQQLLSSIAHQSLNRLQQAHLLTRHDTPQMYLYRLEIIDYLTGTSRDQIGLIATAKVLDYNNATNILKHELTRGHKERACTNFIDSINANPGGPVFLTYEDVPVISKVINDIIHSTTPFLFIPSNETDDHINHSIYKVPKQHIHQLMLYFDQYVNTTYIADGHHRAASISNMASKRGISNDATFSVALFPKSHLKLSSFTRIASGISTSQVFSLITKRFGKHAITSLSTMNPGIPQRKGEIYLYYKKQWYSIILPNYKHEDLSDIIDGSSSSSSDSDIDLDDMLNNSSDSDPVSKLDATILQRSILEDLLCDSSTKLKFVSGNLPMDELMKKVDRAHLRDGSACAFVLKSVSVDDVMKVADQNQIMPPKSTSFEPKLRCGFFTQTF